jgi:LPXTG-motif cell wall-anchored protein
MKRTSLLLALLALSVSGVASAQDPYPPGSATRDSLMMRDSVTTTTPSTTRYDQQQTTTTTDTTLPRTASTTPLIGVLGASMLAAGILLSRPQRRA